MTDRDEKGRFVKGNKAGGRKPLPKELTEDIRANAMEAISTIISLMKNKRVSAGVRLACAEYLLDRGYGKPANVQYFDSLENAEINDPLLDSVLKLWNDASGTYKDIDE